MCMNCAQTGIATVEAIGIEPATTKVLSIATAAVMLFALAAPLSTLSTTVKAGAVCATANQKLVKAGKTYICKKSGTKFVWRVQKKKSKASTPPVTAPNANAQPEPPAQPQQKFEDNYQSIASNLDICRLRETQNIIGAGPKGFPMRSKVPHVGNVKIAIIPVDFGNAVGVGNPGEMYQDDLKEIVDWGNFYGRGKVQYQPYLVSKDWLRAPRGAEWYACVECRKGATTEKQPLRTGFQELINLADPLFDFTNTHFVYFVFPLEAEVKYGTSMYFHRINMQTQEGVMEVSAYGELGGSYWAPSAFPYPRDTIWSHLLHEILHFQGWIGHGPFFELSIMISDWGPSRAVTSWEAFLASWFGEKEIICLEKSKIDKPIYVSQDSIDTMGNAPVSTMIKLSNDEVLVIERRSNGKYSNFSNANNAGGLVRDLNHFTAYFVNVNAQYANLDWNDLTSSKPNFWKYIREGGQIKITKSVTYQGITLEVINMEQIKISVN